jgi:hypothetical protein
MRSRRDDVDFGATIEHARTLGLCGFGDSGSWTDRLGRITGSYFHDTDAAAAAVDRVHVRECRWLTQPLLEPNVPAAVVATFNRGGRNFQQTHDATVGAESQRLWEELSRPQTRRGISRSR